ncbi:MAG TPA: hypothetical protein VH681_10860, partial [Nitrospiraceae bacterium]
MNSLFDQVPPFSTSEALAKLRGSHALLAPGLLWSMIFVCIPLAVVAVVSFATRGTYGGVVWQFSFENYRDLWHVLYGRILLQSLWIAFLTTGICLVLGFPLAIYVSRLSPRRQAVWLLLIMIPFWTNFLVRT